MREECFLAMLTDVSEIVTDITNPIAYTTLFLAVPCDIKDEISIAAIKAVAKVERIVVMVRFAFLILGRIRSIVLWSTGVYKKTSCNFLNIKFSLLKA